MKIESLNNYILHGYDIIKDGVKYCICEPCYLGTHLNNGWDHRQGKPGRRDCKNIIKRGDGFIEQCQCDMWK